MSAIALNILKRLRESGMDDANAHQIAESIDAQMKDMLRESKKYADEVAARFAATADIKFVSNDEFQRRLAEVPTRAEVRDEFTKVHDEFTQVRAEIAKIYAILAQQGKEIQLLRWGVALILGILVTQLVHNLLA